MKVTPRCSSTALTIATRAEIRCYRSCAAFARARHSGSAARRRRQEFIVKVDARITLEEGLHSCSLFNFFARLSLGHVANAARLGKRGWDGTRNGYAVVRNRFDVRFTFDDWTGGDAVARARPDSLSARRPCRRRTHRGLIPGNAAANDPACVDLSGAFGGFAGRSVARSFGADLSGGTLAGALGAVLAAFAGQALRASIVRTSGLPDPLVAFAEDAVAIAGAIAASRETGRRTTARRRPYRNRGPATAPPYRERLSSGPETPLSRAPRGKKRAWISTFIHNVHNECVEANIPLISC